MKNYIERYYLSWYSRYVSANELNIKETTTMQTETINETKTVQLTKWALCGKVAPDATDFYSSVWHDSKDEAYAALGKQCEMEGGESVYYRVVELDITVKY